MESAFIIMVILLCSFAVLGVYDGFYLHIYKYRLYEHKESKGEHLTHTVRGILFPLILYCCYLTSSPAWFFAGLGILALDVIVTIVDAYIEKDSRAFMGGLPRWEYVIHLLVNGFHFASIAVFLVIKIRMTATGITLVNQFDHTRAYTVFIELVKYLIPGAIAIALLHIAVSIPFTAYYWNAFRARLSK